jgi:hypothetical protein
MARLQKAWAMVVEEDIARKWVTKKIVLAEKATSTGAGWGCITGVNQVERLIALSQGRR